MPSKSNLAIGFLTVDSKFICEAHGRAGYVNVYQAAVGSGDRHCGRTLARIEQVHFSSLVDLQLYAVDSQNASHIAISALPGALDDDSFLTLRVTDGRDCKDTSIGSVLVVRNNDTLGVSRSSSLKDVDKEKVSAPDVIRGVALRTYEDEGRAAYMLLPYNMFAKDNRFCQHLLRLLDILVGREPQLDPPPLSVCCAVSASTPDWLSVDEHNNTVKGFNDPDPVPRSRKSRDSGKEADANTLRECVATAGGSIGPLTELGDLQLLHGDRLLDVTVADAAAAATTTDSKHVLYASLTDLNDSGSFPDLLLSVLQPSLGAQGPYQQLYQRLHQHQGRPPAQPSRRPPPPPPQPQLLVWAPVHGSASGQQPHLVSDDEGLVVQQLGEQEWRACKARLEAGGAVLGLAALRLLVGLHYSGAVYSDATMAALRGELARLGAALRRGPPAAAAGGGATQAKQGARTNGKRPAATMVRERRRLDYDECGACAVCLGNAAGTNGGGAACDFCRGKRRTTASQDKENVDPCPSTSQVPQRVDKPTGTSAGGKGRPAPLQDAQPRLQDTGTRVNQGDCCVDPKVQPAPPPSGGGKGPYGKDNAPCGTGPDNSRMALDALQAEKAALEQQAAATAAATAQLAAASRAARDTLPAAADAAMLTLTQAIDEGKKQLAGAKEAAMHRLDRAYTAAEEIVRTHVHAHVQGNPDGKERDMGPLTEAAKGALGALVAAGKEAVRQLGEEAAGVRREVQGAAEGAVRQHAEARAGVRKLMTDAKAALLVDLPGGGGTGVLGALGQLAEDVEAAVEQQAARDEDRVERRAAEGKAAVDKQAAEDQAALEGAVKAYAAKLQSAYCSSMGVVLDRLREQSEDVKRFADALWVDARADGD